MIWIITIVLLVVAGLWIKKKLFSSKTRTSEFVHGPFTIRMEQFTTSDFNMNYGKFYKRTNIAYSVWYDGKLVPYPAELQNNTGFSHLWRVYIVKDAPQPTLFAGSQSLFMIIAKNGTYEVLPLNVQSSDFIKFQWLDATAGQPSPAFELFMADERTSMENPDTLQGGEYLMINQKIVMHIPTIEKFVFNEVNRYVDNYDKDGEALAFSPDKKVIVFPGHFLTWNSEEKPKYHNALMTYDFKKDLVRVLPYSQNDTRLYRPEDLNFRWYTKYFKWDLKENETLLVYNIPDKPEPWQGYFKENFYYLYPTDDVMVNIFKQFILDYMKWTHDAVLSEKYHEYTGHVFQLGKEKSVFYLAGRDKEVIFSKDLYDEADDNDVIRLIHKIGNAFNEVLRSGDYQEHFTAIPENEEY